MTYDPWVQNLHSIGVGGWIVRDDGKILLVRMTYGPSNGLLMIPGGHADAGEFIEMTAVREVREETGLETKALSILMLRQKIIGDFRNLYFVVHLSPLTSEIRIDHDEVSEALWLSPTEILERQDVQRMVKELAQNEVARGNLKPVNVTWTDPSEYKIWG